MKTKKFPPKSDFRREHYRACSTPSLAGLAATETIAGNQSRWLDPAVGRWLSEDPIGFEGGDDNLHRYCRNAATDRVDPLGLDEALAGEASLGQRVAADNDHIDFEISTTWGVLLTDIKVNWVLYKLTNEGENVQRFSFNNPYLLPQTVLIGFIGMMGGKRSSSRTRPIGGSIPADVEERLPALREKQLTVAVALRVPGFAEEDHESKQQFVTKIRVAGCSRGKIVVSQSRDVYTLVARYQVDQVYAARLGGQSTTTIKWSETTTQSDWGDVDFETIYEKFDPNNPGTPTHFWPFE